MDGSPRRTTRRLTKGFHKRNLTKVSRSSDPFSAETLPPGTSLGRYEIRRLLGRGGMGCVYEAEHRDLKKRVAIKTLLPSLAANDEARLRFLREGEAASRIRHPNVVDVTDVGVEGLTSFLVMEYLDGEDLSSLIARQGSLTIEQTADIMLPVAAAITTAHEQGVIHRDLKPANILLARSALGGVQPKVLDFGISKVTGGRGTMVLTGTGATFGTTFYLPPELLQGARQADARSDQYALGTIIYECVTGHRAFEGENLYGVLKDIAEGRYATPLSRRPDLPPTMDALIMRAMSVEPAARFDSVRELGATLLEFASGQARAMWAPFFRGGDADFEVSSSGAYGAPGGTMLLAQPRADAMRRMVTPPLQSVQHPGSSSTLRHATGESMMPIGSVPNLRRSSRTPLLVGLAVLTLAGGGYGAMRLLEHAPFKQDTTSVADDDHHVVPPVERPTFRVEIETEPRAATLELDGHAAGSGALNRRMPSDGVEHVIVARAPGFRDMTLRFTDRSPPHLLALEPAVAPAARPEPVDTGASVAASDTGRSRRERPNLSSRRHHGKGRGADNSADRADNGGKGGPAVHRNVGVSSNDAPIIE